MRAHYLRATSAIALGLSLAFTGQSARAQQSAEGGLVLEEITVTARRVEENLMVVPTSVTSISSKDLEDMGLKDMTQISAFSPSFHFVQQVGGQSGLNDRSQTSLTFRGLVLSPGLTDNGSGSLFIDGSPVGSAQAPSLDEIARVEVLKGPQSAYFGRSTFAGAINYVTKDPNLTAFKGSVSAEYSSYGSNDESVAVEGPIVADKLGVRLSGHHLFKGGHYVNAVNTSQREGDQTTNSVALSAVFTPNDSLHIKAFFNYFTNNDGPAAQLDIKKGDGIFNCTPTAGIYKGGFLCGELPPVSKLNRGNISGNYVMTPFLQNVLVHNSMNYPLAFPAGWLDHFGLKREDYQGDVRIDYTAEAFSVSSLTAVHRDKSASFIDLNFRDAQNIPNGYNTVLHLPNTLPYYSFNLGTQRLYHDWSEELRITSNQNQRFRWTLGGNFIHYYIPATSLYGQTAVGPLDLGGITHQLTNTPAIFGGVHYDVIDNLTFSAEARYQWDIRTTTPVYAGANLLTGAAALPLHGTFKSFSPRVSIDYKYAPDSTVYALFSRGYRPGGFNSFVQTVTPGALAQIKALGGNTNLMYLQERLDNWEAGIKSTFLEGRGRTTLSVYYDKWRNGQISTVLNYFVDPANPAAGSNQVSPIINAGAIDLKGIEFSGDLLVSRTFKVSLNVALNDTKVKFFSPCSDATNINGATSCNGHIPNAPKWSWSVMSEYNDHLAGEFDWFARVDYAHVGKQFTDYTNLAWYGAADLVNLHLGVRTATLTVEAWAKNLLRDSHPYTTTSQVDPITFLPFPAAPLQNDIRVSLPDKRTFGIHVKYNF